MPPVLGLLGGLGGILGALGSALFSIISQLLMGLISSALFGKPKGPKAPGNSVTSVIRSAEEPQRLLYGQRMMSGVLVFAATGRFDEDTIRDLHLVLALCRGPVAELGDVYFNDTISTDARFFGDNGFRLSKHLGATTQAADADLVATLPTQWTTDHRLRGIAYLYARLIWVQSPLIWNSGIPNIKIMVRGLLLYDPRNGLTRYSRNPALALRHYLTLPANEGGFGTDSVDVDDTYVSACANACDEVVDINGFPARQGFTALAGTNQVRLQSNPRGFTLGDRIQVSAVGGTLPSPLSAGVNYWWTTTSGQDPNKPVFGRLSTSYANALAEIYIDFLTDTTLTPSFWRTGQVRYTCDAVISLDQKPNDIIEDLLSCMAGQMAYTQGKWRMLAGVARAASGSIGIGDLRGPLVVQTRTPRRDLFNAVRGTIPDLTRYGQETSFPPIKNPFYATDDGGVEIFRDIHLPAVTSPLRAQRIAKVHLERARQGIVVQAPLNWSALPYAVGDIKTFDDPALGWNAKEFEILDWTLAEGGGVDLVLQEYASAVYDWDDGLATHHDPAPDTDLPDWSDVQAPGLTLSDDYIVAGATAIDRLLLTVVMPHDEFLVRYEVQYRVSGTTAWSAAADNATEILGVEDLVTYDVQVRAFNTLNAPSDWVQASHQVVGQSALPGDVANFGVAVVGPIAFLSWDAVLDLDLSHYRVRFTPTRHETEWGNTVDLVPQVARPATTVQTPARTGTYMVKAVDYKGHESAAAALYTVAVSQSTLSNVLGLNEILTIREEPAFSGTHDGTAVEAAVLRLSSGGLWDAVGAGSPGVLWDDLSTSWDMTGGSVAASGNYTFGTFDLGAVYTWRATAGILASQIDLSDVWDDLSGLWDSLLRLFDGGLTGETNVVLQVRTTDDDPNGSPATWSDWQNFHVINHTSRGGQFRLVLTTTKDHLTPTVSQLYVVIDMEDRDASGGPLLSNAAGSAILFSPSFKATPAVGITADDLDTGDYFRVTLVSATGFTVRFFNAAGTGVARTYKWFAHGYGRGA